MRSLNIIKIQILTLLLTFTFFTSSFSNGAFASWHSDSRYELASVFKLIENNYAPLDYKSNVVGLDWERQKVQTREEFENAKSPREYYTLLTKLFSSLQDAHVSVGLPSNYSKTLPIQFSYVDGKTIVSFIDRTELPEKDFPVHVGDELVLFDYNTPDNLREELATFINNGNDLTNKALLTLMFTSRSESSGIFVPEYDNATLSILSQKDPSTITDYLVPWISTGFPIHGGEGFVDPSLFPQVYISKNTGSKTLDNEVKNEQASLFSFPSSPHDLVPNINKSDIIPPNLVSKDTYASAFAKFLKKNYPKTLIAIEKHNKLFNTFAERPFNLAKQAKTSNNRTEVKNEGNETALGSRLPFFELPNSFEKIEIPFYAGYFFSEAPNLYAGIFDYKKKKVGYLRVSSYVPGESISQIISSFFTLRYYISILQSSTTSLVFDQTNNPGGMVIFSDWLISMLTTGDYKYSSVDYKIRPSQLWIRQFVEAYQALLEAKEEAVEQAEKTNAESKKNNAKMEDFLPFDKDKFEYFEKGFHENYEKVITAYNNRVELSDPVSLRITTEFLYETIMGAARQFSFITNMLQKVPVIGKTFRRFFRPSIYKKPIIMMVNELCFSGGDVTPATLQDNNRVLLVGTNTAGAGGTVGSYSSKIVNPLHFSLTESLMIRPSGKYVENLGVKPDIIIAPTVNDYKDNFKNYFKRVLETSGL